MKRLVVDKAKNVCQKPTVKIVSFHVPLHLPTPSGDESDSP